MSAATKGARIQRPRAKLQVTARCENDCVFCDCAAYRGLAEPDTKALAKKILLASQLGYRQVVFTGGEATLRPDLPKLMALAEKLHMSSGLISNGRRLSDRTYVELLQRHGLRQVTLSIHANKAALHNQLTASKSFDESWAGLQLLHELGLELKVVYVLTRPNLNDLLPLAERLRAFAPLTLEAVFPNPSGIDPARFDELLPTISEAADALAALYVFGDNQPKTQARLTITNSGLPLCALPNYADRMDELREENLSDVSELLGEGFQPAEFLGRRHVAACTECRLKQVCPGVYESYLQSRGEQELTPFLGPISNSFVYEPLRELPDFDIHTCSIRSGQWKPEDPERLLLLSDKSRVRLCRTDSSDFSIEQIRQIKQDFGQLYFDRSGNLYHEDFLHDLVKLSPHPVCTACPDFSWCPALYEFDPKEHFALSEQKLATFFRHLKGELLDVGGGPSRYTKEFSDCITKHGMNYFVLEPNPPQVLLEFLKEHDIEDHLRRGYVEDIDFEAERFDMILVMRSHNHFYDKSRAYRNMLRWLKPGGSLMVVDNIAFGVVRSQEVMQRLRSQGGQPNYEHFSNHHSKQALQIISSLADMELLEHHPVHVEGANQWQLYLKKKG